MYTLIYKPDNSHITISSLHILEGQSGTWTTDPGGLHNTTGVSDTSQNRKHSASWR